MDRLVFAALLAAPACGPGFREMRTHGRGRVDVVVRADETRHCIRTPGARIFLDRPLDRPVDDPELVAQLRVLSVDTRRVLQAVDLEWLLAMLLRERERESGGAEPSMATLELKLQAQMRLSVLEIQLDSLRFEVDCMADELEPVLVELERRERKHEIALAVASIVVGAAAGIGAGAWDATGTSSRGPAAIGIAGGAATAALGIAAFAPVSERASLPHERNVLAPIASGEDPQHLYPAFVFHLLTTARAPVEPSAREQLLTEWRGILDDVVAEEHRKLAERILFGNGGIYDRDLLRARQRMLDALQSQLTAIDFDLELVYRAFASVLDDPAITAGALSNEALNHGSIRLERAIP